MRKQIGIAFYSIDDNEDDLFFIRQIIEEIIEETGAAGYHLFTDPLKFKEALTNDVHVYIIDENLNTTGLTGLDILRAIKEKNEENLVIAFVGYNDPNIMEDYMNEGCNGWVNKNEKQRKEKLTKLLKKGMRTATRRINFLSFIKEEKEKIGK